MSADDLKEEGNGAFNAGDYPKSIELYSKAIEIDDKNHVYYSNRSAAFLKSGDANKALSDAEVCLDLNSEFAKGYSRKAAALFALRKFTAASDAEVCLDLNSEFAKGYSRKAAALFALRKFTAAIETLEEGLAKFPDNEDLKKELEKAKSEKEMSGERVRRSVVTTAAAQQEKKARSESVSDFVKVARVGLELQLYALQAQVKIFNGLSEMTDEEKLDLIFSLLDKDKDGSIDARELANGIRKRNEGMSFGEGLERAINFVAIFDDNRDATLDRAEWNELGEGLERAINFVALFDENGDATLDRAEFKNFIDTAMEEMGATFHEFCEFLILQQVFSDGGNDMIDDLVGEVVAEQITDAVKERGEFFRALEDERMFNLFRMFDTDSSGSIDFKEVAYGLYKLSEDMESSSKAAFQLLLMLDKDDTRELGYEQFTKLILNIAAAGDTKFEEIADALTISAAKPTPLSDEDLAHLIVADEIYNAALGYAQAIEEEIEVDDALCYAKMHKLFDLWDENGDGSINYEELLVGLRKFQGAEDMDESITSAAVMMLATDREGNQTLDREEFARALVKYAKALGVEDFHVFIDFLVVVTVLQDDDENERAYISSIGDIATTEIAIIQGLAQAIGEND
eukprot:CAMPEP_0198306124 /NCGR_PEP_ID=MMETSP1449-20131203/58240_1 /TAXON_ID=420275 /ORGANISM="Attheya septentrionalis, Strain CCMP2084" /LENGTH=628 /DNA_ID=CAMNT_0044008671 /DNA_START=641 /DNA_END=2527 /DNA_ORIENTATION=+